MSTNARHIDEANVPDWTSQQQFVVTMDMLKIRWGGFGREKFASGFCTTPFESGDKARWVAMPPGTPNSFFCSDHDGPDVVERWVNHWSGVIAPILRRWA